MSGLLIGTGDDNPKLIIYSNKADIKVEILYHLLQPVVYYLQISYWYYSIPQEPFQTKNGCSIASSKTSLYRLGANFSI